MWMSFLLFVTQRNHVELSVSTFSGNLLVTKCNFLWCTFGCSLLLSQDNVQLPLGERALSSSNFEQGHLRYQRFSCLTSFEIIAPDQSCHLEPDAAWFSDTKGVWAFQAQFHLKVFWLFWPAYNNLPDTRRRDSLFSLSTDDMTMIGRSKSTDSQLSIWPLSLSTGFWTQNWQIMKKWKEIQLLFFRGKMQTSMVKLVTTMAPGGARLLSTTSRLDRLEVVVVYD